MRILLTNDDGINSDGIYALFKELKKVGPVTIVAPDSQRSSVGHGITLSHPLWVKKIKRDGKFFGYGTNGTPADCVKLAVGALLKRKPDFVVSGINLGPNDGCSVFYSGTVAGAREGVMCGIPSIAVSLDTFKNPDFHYAAKYSAKLVKLVLKNGLPRGTFLNVNVPNQPPSKIKGARITYQGKVPLHGHLTRIKNSGTKMYFNLTGRLLKIEKSLNVDTFAIRNNYISVTPIHHDLTDYKFCNELANWKI